MYKFLVNFIFIKHLFYWGFCWNMLAYRKSYFGPLFGSLDSSECIYTFSVNLSFIMRIFRLWPPLKYAGLRKIVFWASVWDSRSQRMHIHIFGELRFYKSSFLFGLLLKNGGLHKTVCWASVWDSGYQRTHMQISGEIQFDNVYFLLGLLLKNGGL